MAKPKSSAGGVLISGAGSILEGVHISAEGPPITSETNLWAAVVFRAWSDAFVVSNIWLHNSQRGCDPDIVRAEARRWLLLDFGDWRRDRETVCLAANLSPDMIRDAALKRIKSAHIEDKARRDKERASIDKAFEDLLAASEGLSKRNTSVKLRVLAIREALVA